MVEKPTPQPEWLLGAIADLDPEARHRLLVAATASYAADNPVGRDMHLKAKMIADEVAQSLLSVRVEQRRQAMAEKIAANG